MKNDKIKSLVIWFVFFVLSNVLLFFISPKITPTVWATAVFVCISYFSSLITIIIIDKKYGKSQEKYIHISTLLIAATYNLLQLPLCILFALGAEKISAKAAVFVNIVLLIIYIVLLTASSMGNEHINKVNSRQKDNRIKMQ